MNKISKVIIAGFWDDKTVRLDLKSDVNFLIGVNGSGKTTIINLIAATLNADFSTLDRLQFSKITIFLEDMEIDGMSKTAFIEVDKSEKTNSPYPNIGFKIKKYTDKTAKKYSLNELEEQQLIRYPHEYNYIIHRGSLGRQVYQGDINLALKDLVNVTWLSIHRTNSYARRREEKSFESTIDMKIEELQSDLIKYFSILNRRYALETEKFQKFIFKSLIDIESQEDTFLFARNLDANKEKESLGEIFKLFKINDKNFNTKLEKYFNSFLASREKIATQIPFDINDLSYFLGIRRIHSVVQEWSNLLQKQKKINESKDTFLKIINNLLQHKELIINEKNELVVKTNKNIFALTKLSSGEKQLLIILAQSLLQESEAHIYIADEPELSMHVDWQEVLVSSLKSINPQSQIIFATHSPDIVGEYYSSIIKVEKAIS